MEKLYELYFDESYQDKKLFIQEAINAVGSFLHVSIYLYEKSYDQKVCIYRYHEPMAKAIDDSMLETYHKNMLENVHQVHLYPLVIDGMNIGYIYFDMNDLPENHQEFIERFIYILILKLKEDQNQQEIEKLREDNQKLEQTKQQFLANISHEIKTPLSGVYNALYLLNSTDLSDEQKAYHKIGSSSIEQLSSILDDLLDIKKISSGKMEVYKDTFNLEDEMIRVIKMHQLLASEKQIELNISFNHQINFECIGDFRKIRQIVSQLVHNAIKFTQKGFVSLDIMLDTKHEQQILLKVKDSGIGMDEQQVKNIFDMFYQADQKDTRAYQGTGLGLSVTYQLIKLLQGDICVSSVVDQGTEFIVTIPIEKGRVFDYQSLMKSHVLLYDDLNEQEESIFHALGFKVYKQTTIGHSKVDYIVYTKHSHEKDDVEQHKKRYGKPQVLTILFDGVSEKQALYDFVFEKPVSLSVIYQRLLMKKNQMTQAEQYSKLLHAYALIVDDNRLNRVALSNILKKMGLKSKQADSGKAAIEMVKKEAFDCILMDVQMPEMDGIEATRRIRSLGKNYQQIPIIAVTANAFLKDYDVMKTAQITDVIFKPINIDHLEQVLRKYIQSSNDIFIPHDLFVFDQEDFNHRFEGSNDIGNEVLHTFLSEYPKDMKRIHEAIKAQDFKQIEHETHYFKGSCAYLSAKRVVWVLTYMVEHARLNHIDEINDAYPFLSNEIERLIEEIKEYHL
jgi:signal transduction histidine kinase/CheY-like chemotaxis protein/HPt (histidine-containing phosphotransfer) domain-containing protein